MKHLILLLLLATAFCTAQETPEARLATLVNDGVWTEPIRSDWYEVLSLPQDKMPITWIDPATWIWAKGSTLTLMRVTVTSRDTIATYRHYKLVKVTKVHHFDIDQFLKRGK